MNWSKKIFVVPLLETDSIFRSVPTVHPTKELYYPDRATEEERRIAALFANFDSSIDHLQPLKNRCYEYGSFELFDEYLFSQVKIPKSRFTDGSYAVWYGCDSIDSSLHEVAHHLRKQALTELAQAKKETSIRFERAVCKAILRLSPAADIRPLLSEHPQLISKSDYTECQTLGRELRNENFDGIVSKSARHEGHDLFCVFKKESILESVVKSFASITVSKDGTVEIAREEIVSVLGPNE